MHSKILAALLFLSATALADPPTTSEVDAAIAREHDASIRARYHDQETTIAERDIATARIMRETARKQWDSALRSHDVAAAGTWAKRHSDAVHDEAEAENRATYYRNQRDTARSDLAASVEQVRRLTNQTARRDHTR